MLILIVLTPLCDFRLEIHLVPFHVPFSVLIVRYRKEGSGVHLLENLNHLDLFI
ncbi:MAG: hypothetical protein WAV55_09550 [Clostridiaceae bacterium]